MKLLLITALLAVSNGAKLNRGYLPPPSANTAGGHAEDLETPLETPLTRSSPLNQVNQGNQPAGSYNNEFQGVVVDAAAAGTRSSDTGLGLPRPSYGSQASKVGDAAFRTNPQAYSTGNAEPVANPGVSIDGPDRHANIVKYESEVGSDNYNYAFETDNGIAAEENGVASNGVQAQGAFSYKSDDGQTYSVSYTADENGYQPQGVHLPTPPPIPEEILKSLEQNARDEAAGIVDDGSYDASKYNAGKDSNGQSNNGQYNRKQTNSGPNVDVNGSSGSYDSDRFGHLQQSASGQRVSVNGNNQFGNANNGQSFEIFSAQSAAGNYGNDFGQQSASASANGYLPPQESRNQNANRKPERIQSPPDVSPSSSSLANSQYSGRYQTSQQQGFNSASASASFGQNSRQQYQAASTASPQFQKLAPQQQQLSSGYQSGSQDQSQVSQNHQQVSHQQQSPQQQQLGPQHHQLGVQKHAQVSQQYQQGSHQQQAPQQQVPGPQQHQGPPHQQSQQHPAQHHQQSFGFQSTSGQASQQYQQTPEKPEDEPCCQQNQNQPQNSASASASFGNQAFAPRPSVPAQSSASQQYQNQPDKPVEQYRPDPNQYSPSTARPQGQISQSQTANQRYQQQDESYYYNQPAEQFSASTGNPQNEQNFPSLNQGSQQSYSAEINTQLSGEYGQGAKRYPNPPTLAPTFAPTSPTFSAETVTFEPQGHVTSPPSYESSTPAFQQPLRPNQQGIPTQHPQQTGAVPKPFGQNSFAYSQYQQASAGQSQFQQQQEVFPGHSTQQYDGEVYEYNKPEEIQPANEDSSSQSQEIEENPNQSVDSIPNNQASAQASIRGQGFSQASAQFSGPTSTGPSYTGQGEVFGGPRQPPRFDEQTGYHY